MAEAPPAPSTAVADPNRYRATSGGGPFVWIGVPPALFGGWLLYSAAFGQGWADGPGSPPLVAVLGLFGVLLLALGVACIGGRRGLEIDRPNRRVSTWWGLWGPWRSTHRALEEFDRVLLIAEVRRTDRGSRTRFLVQLAGTGFPVHVRTAGRLDPARQESERLAKFLGFPIEDRSGHEIALREAGRLDESVRERMRRLGQKPARPALPESSRLLPDLQPDRATVDLPRPVMDAWTGSILAAVFAFATSVFLAFYLSGVAASFWNELFSGAANAQPGAAAIVLLLIGALSFGPPLVVALPALAYVTQRDHVIVDRTKLRVERRTLFGRRILEADSAEIEQIAVAPPARGGSTDRSERRDVVHVRTDAGTVELGPGCTRVERDWLRDLLLHYLAG